MLHLDVYTLTTLLSAVVVFAMAVCLLMISVPKEPELKNYRIARRFLAGAYTVLSAVGEIRSLCTANRKW